MEIHDTTIMAPYKSLVEALEKIETDDLKTFFPYEEWARFNGWKVLDVTFDMMTFPDSRRPVEPFVTIKTRRAGATKSTKRMFRLAEVSIDQEDTGKKNSKGKPVMKPVKQAAWIPVLPMTFEELQKELQENTAQKKAKAEKKTGSKAK